MSERIITNHEEGGVLRSYVLGFLLSLALTLSAYLLVTDHIASSHQLFTHDFLMFMIIALALLQFFIQLKFFLHLDYESGPRWKLVVFISTAGIILIIIIGSLWIMEHLNYNMMPGEMNNYLIEREAMHQ